MSTFVEFCILLCYNTSVGIFPTGKEQDFLTVFTPAVMPSLLYSQAFYAEFMKGGMLMKSKYRTYGKKTAIRSFRNYHYFDIFLHKSTIAASAKAAIVKNSRL